jgi:hypothetical protein
VITRIIPTTVKSYMKHAITTGHRNTEIPYVIKCLLIRLLPVDRDISIALAYVRAIFQQVIAETARNAAAPCNMIESLLAFIRTMLKQHNTTAHTNEVFFPFFIL